MSKRWSKLQKELYLIRAEGLNMQIHCSIYRMNSQRGQANIPRYWITIDGEIIWDYPKDFIKQTNPDRENPDWYPYVTDIPSISDLIREYIDTPKKEILEKEFRTDHWGLINILRAGDKRVGDRRLSTLKNIANSSVIEKMIAARRVRT